MYAAAPVLFWVVFQCTTKHLTHLHTGYNVTYTQRIY